MTNTWPDARVEELKARWHAGESMRQIAAALGTTRNAIIGKSNRLNLQFHGKEANPIPRGSDADIYATTRFRSRVQPPPRAGVLKPGSYQRKLGAIVRKGPWKGFPIFSLTLEERATCPRSCQQWLRCYGNSSGMSVRYAHGPALLGSIRADLMRLQRHHPGGFVVRLHQLGDFFSVEYVEFWRQCLRDFSALHVFGYTARNYDSEGQPDPIGEAVAALRDKRWDRFAVRTSGAYIGPSTKVITDEKYAGDAIICPAQTVKNKEISCSSCALCWSPAARHRAIAFKAH